MYFGHHQHKDNFCVYFFFNLMKVAFKILTPSKRKGDDDI